MCLYLINGHYARYSIKSCATTKSNEQNINAECKSLSSHKNGGFRIWNNKTFQYINEKKQVYLKHLHATTHDDRAADYKRKSAAVKRET